jgi:hypothetical protein
MDYSICKALSYNMDDIPVALVMLSKKEKSTQVVLKSKNTTKSQEKSSISQKSIASQV